MLESRSGHSLVHLNGFLYAIGGLGLKTVEKFSLNTKKWSSAPSLNEVRWLHESIVFDSKIYVMGSSPNDNTL